MTDNICRIMLDIEGLDTTPSSHILSIGALAFDADGGRPPHAPAKFYAVMTNKEQNRKIGFDTVKWWLTQDKNTFPTGSCPLIKGLNDLSKWLVETVEAIGGELEIWANGITYDIAALEDAYKQMGLSIPWKYNQVRDFRTLKKLFPEIQADSFVGRPHNAVDDAMNQARHAGKILTHIYATRNAISILKETGYGSL